MTLHLTDHPAGSVTATDTGASVRLGDCATAALAVADSGSTLTVKDLP